MNKGLKNCKENFHISALMCKGKLNANLQREGGGCRGDGKGEPVMLYNREDIEGQME